MSSLKLAIESTTGVYRPGELICGKLAVSDLPAKTESIEIRLLWFTRGKGDRDVEVVASKTITRFDEDQLIPFEFTAPRYPNSFSLKLVSVIWTIEAIAFPDHFATNQEIVISPTGHALKMKKIPES